MVKAVMFAFMLSGVLGIFTEFCCVRCADKSVTYKLNRLKFIMNTIRYKMLF